MIDSAILDHFARHDHTLYRYLMTADNIIRVPTPKPVDTHFQELCEIVIGQQLSNKAADTIIARFRTLFTSFPLLPDQILATPHSELRSVGLSNAKANYVRNIADFALTQQLDWSALVNQADDDVRQTLLTIKGVGPWTVEMFLIFVLARPDVFSPGDLGLKKGMMKLYGLSEHQVPSQLTKLTQSWRPYRTIASLALWHCLDHEVTES